MHAQERREADGDQGTCIVSDHVRTGHTGVDAQTGHVDEAGKDHARGDEGVLA